MDDFSWYSHKLLEDSNTSQWTRLLQSLSVLELEYLKNLINSAIGSLEREAGMISQNRDEEKVRLL